MPRPRDASRFAVVWSSRGGEQPGAGYRKHKGTHPKRRDGRAVWQRISQHEHAYGDRKQVRRSRHRTDRSDRGTTLERALQQQEAGPVRAGCEIEERGADERGRGRMHRQLREQGLRCDVTDPLVETRRETVCAGAAA